MHFEGDSRLSDMVVLDPGWLADRMTDLISFKQNWPDGIVNMAQLDVIWKQYEPSRREDILAILERFEVVFLKRSRRKVVAGYAGRKAIQSITVPSLLPLTVDLATVSASLMPAAGVLLHKRVYTLKWMPIGGMARLVARFQAHREFDVTCRWRFGLSFSTIAGQKGLLVCSADYAANNFKLEVVACDGKLASVTSADTQQKTLIHEMVTVVDAWVLDLYAHPSVKRSVVCSNCMSSAPAQEPGVFQYEVLMSLFMEGKTKITCQTCSSAIPVSVLAPDLTFSHLPVLANVTVGEFLGRGGFANVYRGKVILWMKFFCCLLAT
jgi:hypothetical protein